MELPGTFDYAFSRHGGHVLANPVEALRNIREARAAGRAGFCAVVWRRKLDNEWVYRTEQVVEQYLEEPEESDEPTCGPGPFSMANADHRQRAAADSRVREPDLYPMRPGVEDRPRSRHAVEFNMALGPAAELIRPLRGRRRGDPAKLEREIREVLADFQGADESEAPPRPDHQRGRFRG